MQFKIVEKKNHNAVHGLFSDKGRAERHLAEVIPQYVARGYFMDKTLRAEDFKVIAGRAVAQARRQDIRLNKLDLVMDLTAVHANDCPLKLQALLEADEFNFSHDVVGIRRKLDRDTGRLTDEFCPRYAA